MEWQPIETAPKDGSNVLVIEAGNSVPVVAYWDNDMDGGWWGYWQTEQLNPHKPTHWMPLPAPPVAGNESELGTKTPE
jgi:hypothetical protein